MVKRMRKVRDYYYVSNNFILTSSLVLLYAFALLVSPKHLGFTRTTIQFVILPLCSGICQQSLQRFREFP